MVIYLAIIYHPYNTKNTDERRGQPYLLNQHLNMKFSPLMCVEQSKLSCSSRWWYSFRIDLISRTWASKCLYRMALRFSCYNYRVLSMLNIESLCSSSEYNKLSLACVKLSRNLLKSDLIIMKFNGLSN